MPIAIPNFSIRFVQHLAICGRIPLADMGPDFRLPDEAEFNLADFQIAGEEPGLAMLSVDEDADQVGEAGADRSIRFHLHFGKRAFFEDGAPASNSTIEAIQQSSDLLIGKRGRIVVSSRFVAPEQELRPTSLIRPLLGLAYRSTTRSLKLTGAHYEISPPPSAEMSWSFRESDRAVVTDIWANLSNPLEANVAQALLEQLSASFEAFVIGPT